MYLLVNQIYIRLCMVKRIPLAISNAAKPYLHLGEIFRLSFYEITTSVVVACLPFVLNATIIRYMSKDGDWVNILLNSFNPEQRLVFCIALMVPSLWLLIRYSKIRMPTILKMPYLLIFMILYLFIAALYSAINPEIEKWLPNPDLFYLSEITFWLWVFTMLLWVFSIVWGHWLSYKEKQEEIDEKNAIRNINAAPKNKKLQASLSSKLANYNGSKSNAK